MVLYTAANRLQRKMTCTDVILLLEWSQLHGGAEKDHPKWSSEDLWRYLWAQVFHTATHWLRLNSIQRQNCLLPRRLESTQAFPAFTRSWKLSSPAPSLIKLDTLEYLVCFPVVSNWVNLIVERWFLMKVGHWMSLQYRPMIIFHAFYLHIIWNVWHWMIKQVKSPPIKMLLILEISPTAISIF